MITKFLACIAWSVCDRNDVWQNFVGGLIGSLLADGASSPLYKDLIESGLGSEFAPGTGFWTYLKDSMFSAGLREVKETDLDKVHEMVIKSLERAADEGFPQVQGFLFLIIINYKLFILFRF